MTPPPPAPDAEPVWVQRAERSLRYDSAIRQGLVVALIALGTIITMAPPAGTGPRVAAYVLLAVNIAVVAVRVLPPDLRERIAPQLLFPVGVLAAGAVLAFDRTTVTSLFGFFLAGHAGYRLGADRALAVAGAMSVAGTAGVVAGRALGWTTTPWFVGALTGVAVLLGIANRSRAQAEFAQQQAAESRVRAAGAEARAAASAERARVARDVHDVLAHSLAGINLQLEVVDALLENGDAVGAREAAGLAQRQVREGMAEVGRTVHALREDALPLLDTLHALVEAAAPPGTELTVLGAEREIPTPQATALTRVAQESLTNAHKHAPGSPVRITVTFGAGTTALDVVNGRATRAVALGASGSGMGLVGMRERIEIVGGRARTGPVTEGEAAGGWQVHAEVPA